MGASTKARSRRPALLARFPTLRAPRASWPPIPADRLPDYPALAGDLATLDLIVGPAFAKANEEALREQNRYRRQQVLILVVQR